MLVSRKLDSQLVCTYVVSLSTENSLYVVAVCTYLVTEEVEDLYVRVSATVVRLRLSLSHPLQ